MKLQNAVVGTVAGYQIVRFFVLGVQLFSQEPFPEDVVLRTGVLSLSVATLITVVLLIQFILTRAQVLLAPLRIAKLLECTASAAVFTALLFGNAPIRSVLALRGVAAIVLFTDAIVLLFLLLFPRKEQ